MRKGSAVLAIAALLFTGCGGDDDSTGEERPEDIENIDGEGAATVAPTATAPPPTVEPERLTYTVVDGDLISTIAQKFDVPMGALIAVNGIDNPDFIQVGDELVIPTDDEVIEWEAQAAAEAEADAEAPAEPTSATEPSADDGGGDGAGDGADDGDDGGDG